MSSFLIALSCCATLILVFRRFAHALGLMDHPDARKQHHCPIPTVGGSAMYIAVMAVLFFEQHFTGNVSYLMICAGGLMTLGLLDDKHGLPVSIRLMIQIVLVLIVVGGADATISYLGTWSGSDVRLALMFAIPFSLIAFVGSVNAMNMIDGADGMAGSMAFITVLGAMILLMIHPIADVPLVLPLSLLGALAAFLLFNSRLLVKRAWIFMGDAGSMWLGLVVAWLLAQVAQNGSEPWIVLWLFGLPLIDTLTVMFRRIHRKKSPFVADRTHIHHVLERRGFSTGKAVLLASVGQVLLVSVGIAFYLFNAPTIMVFGSFILLFAAYYYLLRHC